MTLPFDLPLETLPGATYAAVMKTPKIVKRYAGLCVALFICAMGVALTTNALLGTSPITSLPYALTFIFPLSLGAFTFLTNTLFVLIQKMLLGKAFGIVQFMQLPAVFVFSMFIDFWMRVTAPFIPEWYLSRMALCVMGSAVLGLGISLEIVCNATVLPGEGMVIAIAHKTHQIFGNIKMLFDISLVIIAAVLGWLVLNEVVGLREGTVISAVLVGPFVKFFSRWTRHLAPLF